MSVPASLGSAQPSWRARGTALLSVFLAGCVKTLPPAATPEQRVPAVSAVPPRDGHGRLVVDVVDGPTPVHRVRMEARQLHDGSGRFRFFESPEPLCTSPCAADLPLGNILLGFPLPGDPGAMETELVHIGPQATVYRRALSQYQRGPRGALVLGIIGTALGASSAITGMALLPIGLHDESKGLTVAGATTLGAGAVVLALGIWAIRLGSPTYRPGASLHFPVPGSERSE